MLIWVNEYSKPALGRHRPHFCVILCRKGTLIPSTAHSKHTDSRVEVVESIAIWWRPQ